MKDTQQSIQDKQDEKGSKIMINDGLSNQDRQESLPLLSSNIDSFGQDYISPLNTPTLAAYGATMTSPRLITALDTSIRTVNSPMLRISTASSSTSNGTHRSRLTAPFSLSQVTQSPSRLERKSNLDLRESAKNWIHRRNGLYDEAVQGPSTVGRRVWYENYTTIDWIHDCVKERVRLRSIRKKNGWRGRLYMSLDAMQAWIVLSITGIIAGIISAIVDFGYTYLQDLKFGYCKRNVFLKYTSCCPNDSSDFGCHKWTTWADALGYIDVSPQRIMSGYIMYILLGVLFSAISGSFVLLSAGASLVSSPPLSNGPERPYSTSSSSYSSSTHFFAAGSGLPEVKTILGGFVIRGFLGLRVLVIKTIALIFSIASGLMIGMQGPLVHISCAVGNVVSRQFAKFNKNEGKRREILSAACAAGVSVAFGAPLGGVLFSLEEVSFYFPLKTMWRAFYCALIAAVTVKLLDPVGAGKIVLFQVSYTREWNFLELVPFALLGVFGGLMGAIFIKLSLAIDKLRIFLNIKWKPVTEVVFVSCITGAVSYLYYFTRIGNQELVAKLFSQCSNENKNSPLCQLDPNTVIEKLIWTLCVKFAFMIFTFGIKVPGGVFIPSMVIGACAGRIMGIVIELLQQRYTTCAMEGTCVIPGVYALVGAAACLSGVTRMTVSLTVIMFELTGALSFVLPVMTSIMTAKWVADAFGRKSIYAVSIEKSGYPYLDHKQTLTSKPAIASDMMTRGGDVLVVDQIYTVYEISHKLSALSQFHSTRDSGFPVVKSNGVLVGYISQTELEHATNVVRNASDPARPIVIHNLQRIDTSNSTHHDDFETLTASAYFTGASPEPMTPIPDLETLTAAGPSSSESGVDIGDARPLDVSQWVDQAPLSVSERSSVELVAELFMKLGCRSLCVVNEGVFVGTIHKKRFLAFMQDRAETF